MTLDKTSNYQAPSTKNNPFSPPENFFWLGVKKGCYYLYSAPAGVIGIAALGVLSEIFAPSISLTCYTLAGTALVSKWLITFLSSIHFPHLEELERYVDKIKKNQPYIQTASLIATLAIAYFFPILGVILAIGVGLFNGILYQMEYCETMQKINAYNHKIRLEGRKASSLC